MKDINILQQLSRWGAEIKSKRRGAAIDHDNVRFTGDCIQPPWFEIIVCVWHLICLYNYIIFNNNNYNLYNNNNNNNNKNNNNNYYYYC